MSNPTRGRPKSTIRRYLKPSLGYLLAAIGLVWVFHDIRLEELPKNIFSVNWSWVAIGVAFDILSYLCQGLRWSTLLRPLGSISVLKTTQAIYVGLFTNEIIPMRAGELVRVYLVSRWLSVRFASVIPSLAVERLIDGVWLAIAIGLVAILVQLPKDLLEAGEALGVIVLLATALFIYLVLHRRKNAPPPSAEKSPSGKLFGRIKSFFSHLSEGLHAIGTSRFIYLGFVFSAFILVFQMLAFWAVMWAYGLKLSFWTGAAVLIVVHLGTALPNAPSNVGTYQFFCVVGLSTFGIDKTLATGFSVVVFVVLTIPLWVLGLLALSRTGMTLRDMRSDINKLLSSGKIKS